jgi:hypothetical protein
VSAGLNRLSAAGFFLSNADNASQVLVPFDTLTVNLPFISISWAEADGIVVFSTTAGPSTGLSFTNYLTTTVGGKFNP